jgi:hypothetical protein
MKLKFQPFSATALQATQKSWKASVARLGGFLPSLDQLFDWATKNAVEKTAAHGAYEIAYGVFEAGNDVAHAICEVTVNRRSAQSKWVKMLNLRLHPLTEDGVFKNDVVATQTAINAYVTCILGVFTVKTSHNADTLKVYGRTHEQLSLLTALATTINAGTSKHKLTSRIDGRWLVVN